VAATMRTSTGRSRGVADATHSAGLQDTGELGLERAAQIADLVQQKRAVRGGLEESWTVGLGSGEGSTGVPEEFGFEQVARDCGAVDGEERSFVPWG
jgi:hypothetical protein